MNGYLEWVFGKIPLPFFLNGKIFARKKSWPLFLVGKKYFCEKLNRDFPNVVVKSLRPDCLRLKIKWTCRDEMTSTRVTIEKSCRW